MAPYSFRFRKNDDLVEIRIHEADAGCTLTFCHTFDDRAMAIYIAASLKNFIQVFNLAENSLFNGRTLINLVSEG